MYKQKEDGKMDYDSIVKEFASPFTLLAVNRALEQLYLACGVKTDSISSYRTSLRDFTLLLDAEARAVVEYIDGFISNPKEERADDQRLIEVITKTLHSIDPKVRLKRYNELEEAWTERLKAGGFTMSASSALTAKSSEIRQKTPYTLYREAGAKCSGDITSPPELPSLGIMLKQRRIYKTAQSIGLCPALIERTV